MKKAVELLDLYEITVPDNGDKEKQFFKFFYTKEVYLKHLNE